MNKLLLKSTLGGLLLTLVMTVKAYAMCPVCTLAVAGALVLAEKYGVDNTISGLWFGALGVSVSFWTIDWLKKRNYSSRMTEILVFIFYYASMIVPLYLKGAIGLPTKRLWGVDKVVLGMMIGSIFFYLSFLLYLKIKKMNNNKPWFPFQRVVMPILTLGILSLIFYFITK